MSHASIEKTGAGDSSVRDRIRRAMIADAGRAGGGDRGSKKRRGSARAALRKLGRYFTALGKLGRTYERAKQSERNLAGLPEALETLQIDLLEVRGQAESVRQELEDIKSAHRDLMSELGVQRRSYSELARSLAILFRKGSEESEADRSKSQNGGDRREALDPLLDSFYFRLEERFRGSREEIRNRLKVYLPDLQNSADLKHRQTGRVLDLGCGRGEWLELLKSRGMEAVGVDTNAVQLSQARELGLIVHEMDAIEFLRQSGPSAYSAVTAHHLVEHLPIDTVFALLVEALRVLEPGGLLILETPHPGNIVVGATTFHLDPTHRRPLPPDLLETIVQTIGFEDIEIRPLHPSTLFERYMSEGRWDPALVTMFFGPQDYAVLARKPA